jgi:hypothetical protein
MNLVCSLCWKQIKSNHISEETGENGLNNHLTAFLSSLTQLEGIAWRIPAAVVPTATVVRKPLGV